MFKRRVAVTLAVLFLTASAWGQTPKNSSPKNAIDTKYIYKDAAIVFIAHPKRMLARKTKLKAMIQQGVTTMKEFMGLDAENLQQVVFQFGVETKDKDTRVHLGANEVLTGIFRFSEPIDADAFVQKSLKENKKLKRNGQLFYQPPSETRVAVWVPDNKTLVLGARWRLIKLMAKADHESSVISRLKDADAKADATVEIDFAQAAPLLGDILRSIPPNPVISADSLKSLDRLSMSMNWLSGKSSILTLHTKDDQAAQLFNNQISLLLATGKATWPKARDSLKEAVPAPQKDMADVAFEAIDKLLAGTKTSSLGKQMTIEIPKDVDFVALGAGTFMSTAGAERAVRRPERDVPKVKNEPLDK